MCRCILVVFVQFEGFSSLSLVRGGHVRLLSYFLDQGNGSTDFRSSKPFPSFVNRGEQHANVNSTVSSGDLRRQVAKAGTKRLTCQSCHA